MSSDDLKLLGGNWDLGGEIISNLAALPIQQYIKKSCREQGVDLNLPERKLASNVLAPGLAATLAGAMGGPVAFVMGLLFYSMAVTAEYPGDRRRAKSDEKRKIALAILRLSVDALKENVSPRTWERICDDMQEIVAYYDSDKIKSPNALETLSLFYDAIANISPNAALQWRKTIDLGLRNAGLTERDLRKIT